MIVATIIKTGNNMLTENMKAITDVAEQIIKDNGYLTKNNLQESFNEVINRAEARGHLEMTDVRKLADSGIPLLSFCTDRSVFFDAIRYRFEKWLNSL